jgi:hypothetical protein
LVVEAICEVENDESVDIFGRDDDASLEPSDLDEGDD